MHPNDPNQGRVCVLCGGEVPAGTRLDHGSGYCRFPIQGGLTVSVPAARVAYESYAKRYGTDQSLLRLAERGGFGLHEFVWLYRGARVEEIKSVLHGTEPWSERFLVETLRDADVRSTIGGAS